MRYILTLLLLSAAILKTAAQENYTLADTLTLDAVVVTGVTLTSMTDEGNLRFNVSKIEGNTGADITNILDRLPGVGKCLLHTTGIRHYQQKIHLTRVHEISSWH